MAVVDTPPQTKFETSVVTGNRLLAMTKGVRNWQERDCFGQLQKYLNDDSTDRVCLVFGLRRTGKTTMLRQAVLNMTSAQAAKTAYIKAKGTDTMEAMNRDLEKLLEQGLLMNTFVTVVPFGQENWILMMTISTQRTLLSGMMSLHEDILILLFAKIFTIP